MHAATACSSVHNDTIRAFMNHSTRLARICGHWLQFTHLRQRHNVRFMASHYLMAMIIAVIN